MFIPLKLSYLAGVLSFDAGVVGELDKNGVAAAQICAKVDGFLWWWWQSTEKQVIVEVSQIITTQSQTGCGLACMQGLILKAQRTLKRGTHTHTHTQLVQACLWAHSS